CDQTGVPHFHSSTLSGSAFRMISRTRRSVSPRQSPSSSIRLSISREAEASSLPRGALAGAALAVLFPDRVAPGFLRAGALAVGRLPPALPAAFFAGLPVFFFARFLVAVAIGSPFSRWHESTTP